MEIKEIQVKIKPRKRVTFWPAYFALVAVYVATKALSSDNAEKIFKTMFRLMFDLLYRVEVK